MTETELKNTVLSYVRKNCAIPKDFDWMLVEIVNSQLAALHASLGNLALCFYRSVNHADEFKKNMHRTEAIIEYESDTANKVVNEVVVK